MKKNNIFYLGIAIIFIGGLFLLRAASHTPQPPTSLAENYKEIQTDTSSAAPSDTDDTGPLLQTLDGTQIALADYIGKKPVVLDFWTTWCHNCQRNMPKESKLYEQYKDQIEIIGINMNETRSVIERFVDSKGITFPIAFDPGGRLARQFNVRYTNTHVFIDKQGNVTEIAPRDLTERDIKRLINP